MATVRKIETGGSHPTRQPSRWKRNWAVLALLAAVIGLAFTWSALKTRALATTSFGARSGCVCRFVSGLPLASCKADAAMGGMGRTSGLMMLGEDAKERSVTASVPLLASQTAKFDPDHGCQLEPWDN